MYISSLSLANFRNYTSEKIEFSPYTNVIYGDNAQGKTNILEAVYIFSQGFRSLGGCVKYAERQDGDERIGRIKEISSEISLGNSEDFEKLYIEYMNF